MPKLRKPPRPPPDVLARIRRLPAVRDKALRAVGREAPPVDTRDVHREVVVALWLALSTTAYEEERVAVEFFRCYSHIIKGEPIEKLPLTLIDPSAFHSKLERVLDQGTQFPKEQ